MSRRAPSGRGSVAFDSAVGAAGFFDPMLATPEAAEQVRSVLSLARSGSGGRPPGVELDVGVRRRLVAHHRLGPLVEVGWTERPTESVGGASYGPALDQLRLRAVADEVVQCLSAAGIECRVLKGLATGALDYDRRALRYTGDVDLYVPVEVIEDAAALLVRSGSVMRPGERLPAMLEKGPTLVHPSGVEIDLHYRLSIVVPAADSSVLLADGVEFDGGLVALPTELRLLHAAIHGLTSRIDDRRLSSVADVVAIVDNTGVDWGRARSAADALGATPIVSEALHLEALLMDRPHHPGLDWPRLTPWTATALLSGDMRVVRRHMMTIMSLDSNRRRAAYLQRLLVASPEVRAQRGGWAAHARATWKARTK